MTVKPETISAYSAELQNMPLLLERAAELAQEVGGMNEKVMTAAAGGLGFYDEPMHFLGVLEHHAEAFK